MDFEFLNSLQASKEIIDGLGDIVANSVSGIEEDIKDIQASMDFKQNSVLGKIRDSESKLLSKKLERESLQIKLQELEQKAQEQKRPPLTQKNTNVSLEDQEALNSINYYAERIEYARSKIKLFYNISKIKWDLSSFRISGQYNKQIFALEEYPGYDATTKLWNLID